MFQKIFHRFFNIYFFIIWIWKIYFYSPCVSRGTSEVLYEFDNYLLMSLILETNCANSLTWCFLTKILLILDLPDFKSSSETAVVCSRAAQVKRAEQAVFSYVTQSLINAVALIRRTLAGTTRMWRTSSGVQTSGWRAASGKHSQMSFDLQLQ